MSRVQEHVLLKELEAFHGVLHGNHAFPKVMNPSQQVGASEGRGRKEGTAENGNEDGEEFVGHGDKEG